MSLAALVVIGGGGHSLVVVDAALREGWSILGLTDLSPKAPAAALVRHLGQDDALGALEDRSWMAVLGIGSIGSSTVREKIVAQLAPPGGWATVRHPASHIGSLVEVAEGVVAFAGTVVNPKARIGAHSILNTSSVVEHECVIGRFVHIAPRAVLGAACLVGDGAHIGIGAVVRQGITIGARAIVGAGAVVVKDVAPGVTVIGSPARPSEAPPG